VGVPPASGSARLTARQALPTGVAVHPVTLQVFVVNAGDGTVSVIDSLTFRVIANRHQDHSGRQSPLWDSGGE
jgi:DNA-binding beta-propeller fold protein YncE